MTNTFRAIQTQEINAINAKVNHRQTKLQSQSDNLTSRQQFTLHAEAIDLEQQANNLLAELSNPEPITQTATAITIHALKLLARGRKLTNAKLDENSNRIQTHADNGQTLTLLALQLLRNGTHETSGILDDLIQETTLAIWEAIAENKIIIDKAGKLQTTNENDTQTLKSIYNAVQGYLYRHQQRHYKQSYTSVYDEQGNESIELVTKAMRNWEIQRNTGDIISDLLEELQDKLERNEMLVLSAMLDYATKEEVYYSKGERKTRIIQHNKTIRELAAETGLSRMTCQRAKERITAYAMEICNASASQRNA